MLIKETNGSWKAVSAEEQENGPALVPLACAALGGLHCQEHDPGLQGGMAESTTISGNTLTATCKAPTSISHVWAPVGYYIAFLMTILFYINYLKFIIPPAVIHEVLSLLCAISHTFRSKSFCDKQLFVTRTLRADVGPNFSAAQRRGGIVNIPSLWEGLQNNNTGSWNNHSAISCSPLGLPTRSHMENC